MISIYFGICREREKLARVRYTVEILFILSLNGVLNGVSRVLSRFDTAFFGIGIEILSLKHHNFELLGSLLGFDFLGGLALCLISFVISRADFAPKLLP